jgi:hypothetical protein
MTSLTSLLDEMQGEIVTQCDKVTRFMLALTCKGYHARVIYTPKNVWTLARKITRAGHLHLLRFLFEELKWGAKRTSPFADNFAVLELAVLHARCEIVQYFFKPRFDDGFVYFSELSVASECLGSGTAIHLFLHAGQSGSRYMLDLIAPHWRAIELGQVVRNYNTGEYTTRAYFENAIVEGMILGDHLELLLELKFDASLHRETQAMIFRHAFWSDAGRIITHILNDPVLCESARQTWTYSDYVDCGNNLTLDIHMMDETVYSPKDVRYQRSMETSLRLAQATLGKCMHMNELLTWAVATHNVRLLNVLEKTMDVDVVAKKVLKEFRMQPSIVTYLSGGLSHLGRYFRRKAVVRYMAHVVRNYGRDMKKGVLDEIYRHCVYKEQRLRPFLEAARTFWTEIDFLRPFSYLDDRDNRFAIIKVLVDLNIHACKKWELETWEDIMPQLADATRQQITTLRKGIVQGTIKVGLYLARTLPAHNILEWYKWLAAQGVCFANDRGGLYQIYGDGVPVEVLTWVYEQGQHVTTDTIIHLFLNCPSVPVAWLREHMARHVRLDTVQREVFAHWHRAKNWEKADEDRFVELVGAWSQYDLSNWVQQYFPSQSYSMDRIFYRLVEFQMKRLCAQCNELTRKRIMREASNSVWEDFQTLFENLPVIKM